MPDHAGTSYKLRERGDSWQYDFMHGGKRHRQSFATAAEAEVAAKATIDRLLAGQSATPPTQEDFANPTLQHVFDVLWAEEWKGTKSAIHSKKNAEDCIAKLGNPKVCDVTTGRVDQLIADLKADELDAGTIRRKLAALSRLLHFAAEKEWIKAVPVIRRKKAGKERVRNRYYSHEEEKLILGWMEEYRDKQGRKDFNPDFFAFLIDTGLRLGEAVALEWDEVSWSADGKTPEWVRVPENKADYPRSVPCTMRVQEMLTRRRAARPIGEKRVWWDMWKDRAHYQWEEVRAAMGKQEDADWVIHTCRHTFASRLAMAAVPLGTIKELGGWKTLAMVMRYAHLCPDTKLSAIRQMEQKQALKIG